MSFRTWRTSGRWIVWSAAMSATARRKWRFAPRSKAVLGRKQVAVLGPTTVLVEQHYATFCERLKSLPVIITSLSRLRSRAEQTQVLKGAWPKARQTSSSARIDCCRPTSASKIWGW